MSVYTMWRHFCLTVSPRILRKYFSISPCSLKNLGKLLEWQWKRRPVHTENFPFILFSGAQNSVSECVSVTQESFMRTCVLITIWLCWIELESNKQFQQNTRPFSFPNWQICARLCFQTLQKTICPWAKITVTVHSHRTDWATFSFLITLFETTSDPGLLSGLSGIQTQCTLEPKHTATSTNRRNSRVIFIWKKIAPSVTVLSLIILKFKYSLRGWIHLTLRNWQLFGTFQKWSKLPNTAWAELLTECVFNMQIWTTSSEKKSSSNSWAAYTQCNYQQIVPCKN